MGGALLRQGVVEAAQQLLAWTVVRAVANAPAFVTYVDSPADVMFRSSCSLAPAFRFAPPILAVPPRCRFAPDRPSALRISHLAGPCPINPPLHRQRLGRSKVPPRPTRPLHCQWPPWGLPGAPSCCCCCCCSVPVGCSLVVMRSPTLRSRYRCGACGESEPGSTPAPPLVPRPPPPASCVPCDHVTAGTLWS